MTSIEILSTAILSVASAEHQLDAEAVAEMFSSHGWEMTGATSLPFPRKWIKDGVQASIFGREDPSIEFVLSEIAPDWEDPTYVEAVTSSYAPQIREIAALRETLFAELGQHSEPQFVSEISEVEEFIDGSDWSIGGALLSIGVAHLDADDLPVLSLIYVRQARGDHE